jgi:hypothetical protein
LHVHVPERRLKVSRKESNLPPAYTSSRDYLESVAHLHADSQDLVSRGLAVGCLSAIGKE